MRLLLIVVAVFSFVVNGHSQNSKIKCYFNKPVDNSLATTSNAVYLSGTFPDTIAAYINRAKYTLDIALYNLTSNGTDIVSKIINAVNAAYNRGVVVRWVFDSSSSNTGMAYLNSAIPRIGSPTSSSYGIMHNKFVVIDVNSANADDVFVISGSYNFSTQQTNTDYNNIIIIQDKPVATAYYNEFNKFWGGTGNTPNFATSTFGKYKTTSLAHYFNVNGTQVQVHFSPKDTCAKYLKAVINSANNDLTFGIYTFTDNSIATPILNKFNAGIKVRGIMDVFSQSYTPYSTLATPLGSNLVNYTGSGLYHSKLMVVDALQGSSDAQVLTGSFNWSTSAQTVNDENILILHDSAIANQYYQSICRSISDNGGTPCVSPITLPVEWLSFAAKRGFNNNVLLNWQTAVENNSNHFEVERSAEGIRYTRIGWIKSNEIATGSSYEFEDKDNLKGLSYYRIKQVDNDGNATYSKIVSVNGKISNGFEIYPNPATSFIKLNVTGLIGRGSVLITDFYGVLVQQQRLNPGINTIDINRLAKGMYFVSVITDDGKNTEKLIIE